MRCSVLKNWIAGVLLLLSVGTQAATEEKVACASRFNGGIASISVNNPLSVQDQYAVYNPSQPGFWVSNQEVLISLKYLQEIPATTNFSYDLDVTVEVSDHFQNPTQLTYHLAINYIVGSSGPNVKYKDLDVVQIPCYNTIKIISVTETTVGNVPTDIVLEVKSKTDRHYYLDENDAVVPTGTFNSLRQTYDLGWTHVLGAESYDLEWVFLDEGISGETMASDFVLSSVNGAREINWRDAVRINLTGNQYSIPMVYPKGLLVYRIRPVGVYAETQELKRIKLGAWSKDPNSTGLVSNSVLADPNKASYAYYLATGFESNKNWQYSMSFVEDGKRGEQIAYYDGANFERQSLSLDNSTNTAILSEVYYDYMGRPAVQPLPAPLQQPNLHFVSTAGLRKADFDLTTNIGNPIPMPANNPAALYYSDQNPFNTTVNRDFIPAANDFVYSRVIYTKDGTNRPVRAFSPGEMYRGASNVFQHGVSTYYGTPTSTELIRLFGNEIGVARNYKKVTTTDENGQSTVKYLDGAGKVIATALSGEKPQNLVEIDDAVSAQVITSNGLANDVINQNKERLSTIQIVSPTSNQFTYAYSLQSPLYTLNCINTNSEKKNFRVPFKLEVSILDQEAANPVLYSGTYTTNNSGVITATNQSNPLAVTTPGTYTIQRSLKVDEDAVNAYLKNVRDELWNSRKDPNYNTSNGCVPYEIATESNCGNPCDLIYKLVLPNGTILYYGQDPSYTVPKRDNNPFFIGKIGADSYYFPYTGSLIPNVAGIKYKVGTNLCPYEKAISECNPNFNLRTIVPNECEMKKTMMINDLLPGGQYWNASQTYINLISGYFSVSGKPQPFGTSTFENCINSYLASKTTSPSSFTFVTDFSTFDFTNFKENMFIDLHPEYELYVNNCESPYFTNSSCNFKTQNQIFNQYAVIVDDAQLGSTGILNMKDNRSTPSVPLFSSNEGCNYSDANSIDPLITCYNSGLTANSIHNFSNNVFVQRDFRDELRNAFVYYFETSQNTTRVNNSKKYFSIWDILNFDASSTSSINVQINSDLNAKAYALSIQTAIASNPGLSKESFLKSHYLMVRSSFLYNYGREYSTTSTLLGLSGQYIDYASPKNRNNGYTLPSSSTFVRYFPKMDVFEMTKYPVDMSTLSGKLTSLIGTQTGIDPVASKELTDQTCALGKFVSYLMEIDGLTIPNSGTPDWFDFSSFPGNFTAIQNQIALDFPTLAGSGSWANSVLNDPVLLQNWISNYFGLLNGQANAYSTAQFNQFFSDPFNTFLCAELPTNLSYETCIEEFNRLRELKADALFMFKMDAFLKKVKNDIMTLSLAAVENFNVSYILREYHYTLYYYDQAGNLIKTVPPAGVRILSANQVALAENYIKNPSNGTFIYPGHSLITNYVYNSLNQVVKQTTPDAGVTNFWYDRLGRIVLSQNDKQNQGDFEYQPSIPSYSYVQYDDLGRTVEGGLCYLSGSSTGLINPNFVSGSSYLDQLNNYNSGEWYTIYDKYEVTKSFFDQETLPVGFRFGPNGQENLRGRIASVAYYEHYQGRDENYFNASHFTYDAMGNVPTLIQEDKAVLAARFKQIDYSFDLFSGKVNEVWYQRYYKDQLAHRYEYDANNRVIAMYSSTDGLIWNKDAGYGYYQHGPLARTELGEKQVQGTDMAYTIQGWIKSVNSAAIGGDHDMGADGFNRNSSNTLMNQGNKRFARDAFGYTLTYAVGEDYRSISQRSNQLDPHILGDLRNGSLSNLSNDVASLYNGNISAMTVDLPEFALIPDSKNTQLIANIYTYDVLNRIYASQTKMHNPEPTDIASISNQFSLGALSSHDPLKTSYAYDPNGNITGLSRKTIDGTDMDQLSYIYNIANPGSGQYLTNNQLIGVQDAVSFNQTGFSDIKPGQNPGNYQYDKAGNLISDDQEGITKITWSITNKVRKIEFRNKPTVEYIYDAMGNRIGKMMYVNGNEQTPVVTRYVRDGEGNTMAVYTESVTQSGQEFTATQACNELHLYGSSRVGMIKTDGVEFTALFVGDYGHGRYYGEIVPLEIDENFHAVDLTNYEFESPTMAWGYSRTLGNKVYELSNHLGNVQVTITDGKYSDDSHSTSWMPTVASITDYYPFGMEIAERTWSMDEYRFSMNTQEKSPEIANSHTTALYWEYDGRLGRRWNLDPVVFPYESQYCVFGNNPILSTDVKGDIKFKKSENCKSKQQWKQEKRYLKAIVQWQKEDLAKLTEEKKEELANANGFFGKNAYRNYYRHYFKGSNVTYTFYHGDMNTRFPSTNESIAVTAGSTVFFSDNIFYGCERYFAYQDYFEDPNSSIIQKNLLNSNGARFDPNFVFTNNELYETECRKFRQNVSKIAFHEGGHVCFNNRSKWKLNFADRTDGGAQDDVCSHAGYFVTDAVWRWGGNADRSMSGPQVGYFLTYGYWNYNIENTTKDNFNSLNIWNLYREPRGSDFEPVETLFNLLIRSTFNR